MAKKKASRSQSSESDSGRADLIDKSDDIDFEASMREIEQIVVALESGELGLGESLQRYERAVGQLKKCHGMLQRAERKVSLLTGIDADGNPITEPHDDDATDDLTAKQTSRSRRRGVVPAETDDEDEPGLF